MGGRYRLGDTTSGAFGLSLTSRKSLQAPASASRPVATARNRFFICGPGVGVRGRGGRRSNGRRMSEPEADAEVEPDRHREVAVVDAGCAGATDRGAVPVHDRVEARVVGEE